MKQILGYLKATVKVNCSICSSEYSRKLKGAIYENTPAEIEKVKTELKAKASKIYTCKICKSIINN